MNFKMFFDFNTSIGTKSIIFISTFLMLISFGYFATNLAIAGDDWTSITTNNFLGRLTISVGRWMHYSISWLFEGKLYAPTFTFGILILFKLISVWLITKIFKFENSFQKLFFAALFVTVPIWYEAYLFQMGRIPKGLGLLSSVLSAYLFIFAFKDEFSLKKTVPLLILSATFLTLSMGCYQTYSFFAIIIVLIYFLQSEFDGIKPFLVQGLSLIGVFIVAVGLYYLVTALFLNFHDLKIHDGGRYDIKNVVTSNSIVDSIKGNFTKIKDFYGKAQLLIPQFTKLLLVFSFLLFLMKTFIIGSKNKVKGQFVIKTIKLICLIVIIILPFILGFIREKSPLRFNSVTSLSIVFAYFLSFPLIFRNWFGRIWIVVLTAIVITFCFWNSAASFSKFISNKRDIALSEKLLNYIHASPNYTANPKTMYKIYFIGDNPYLESKRPFDIIIDSKFRITSLINTGVWDGQIGRMKNIFTILGEQGKRFTFYPSNSIKSKEISKQLVLEKMYGEYKDIKNWPHKNSVVSIKDTKKILVIFNKKALK